MAIDWNSGIEAGSNYATGQEPWAAGPGLQPSATAGNNPWLAYNQALARLGGGERARQQVGTWQDWLDGWATNPANANYSGGGGSASVAPSGGSTVTGGTSGGGGGSGGSTFSGAIGFYPAGGTGGRSGGSMDEQALMDQVRSLFEQMSAGARSRAAADVARYRSSQENQLATSYLTDLFQQGLSTRMADELAGRLRTAQSARGLAVGGASAMAEATLLTSMAEKQRAELLPTLLQKAQYESTLGANLEQSYAASGAASAQGAAGMGAVFADLFRTAQNQGGGGNAQYNALAALFGNTPSYYPFAG